MLNAVAAIFTCGDKVFSIRRQTHLRAFPGYYAFPGGKIDEGDEDYAGSQPLTDEFPAAEIGALIREIEEELGFDLAEAMRLQQVKYVSKFGTAVTPALQTQRFNAHFYRVELTQEQTFTLDSGEIEWGEWISMTIVWMICSIVTVRVSFQWKSLRLFLTTWICVQWLSVKAFDLFTCQSLKITNFSKKKH